MASQKHYGLDKAQDLFSRIDDEPAENNGVTERLKAENRMESGGRMNRIRDRAREIANHDIVFRDTNITHEYKEEFEPPNTFWKYYDLYRRARINLAEFSKESGLSIMQIERCLLYINNLTVL